MLVIEERLFRIETYNDFIRKYVTPNCLSTECISFNVLYLYMVDIV